MLTEMIIAQIKALAIKSGHKLDHKYLTALKKLKRKDLFELLNSYKEDAQLMVS